MRQQKKNGWNGEDLWKVSNAPVTSASANSPIRIGRSFMIIEKQYKFYAAHRNETLQDKCSNLHGHRYGLRIHFEVEREGDISTLFGDFDGKIEPYLKQNFDHGMLINRTDPLYETLQDHMARTGENLRLKVFDGPTSVENLAWILFSEITEMGFRLDCIEVQETDTSTIRYTREDWVKDNRHFASKNETKEATE